MRMRGRVSRTILSGLLAGCMVVTPLGAAYAEAMPAEPVVEITAEESVEIEKTSESIASEADAETPGETLEASEPEETPETVETEAIEESGEVIVEEAEAVSLEAGYSDPVKDFVARLYEYILQRRPDGDGLNAWTDVLKSGREQGAKVAQGFIESPEFQSRRMDDTTYLTILYKTFLNRKPDAAGLKAWQAVLDSGLSRMHVFRGFAESKEFTEICQRYGIQRGYAILNAPMDQNEGVTKFVVRCYRLCLGREADEDGLNAWCNALLTGRDTAKEVAYGFFFSQEFERRNIYGEDYVRLLYNVLMEREPDLNGLDYWNTSLMETKSREYVFNSIADSQEFRDICARYGIQSGSGIYIGWRELDAGDYLGEYLSLPDLLNMKPLEDIVFGGKGIAYASESGFYLSYEQEQGRMSLINVGADNVMLSGGKIGDDAEKFQSMLFRTNWEAGFYGEDEDGNLILAYARTIGEAPYIAYIILDSDGFVTSWIVNNWVDDGLEQYFECLRK